MQHGRVLFLIVSTLLIASTLLGVGRLAAELEQGNTAVVT